MTEQEIRRMWIEYCYECECNGEIAPTLDEFLPDDAPSPSLAHV